MRKLWIFLLACAMIVGLTGCSLFKKTEPMEESSETTTDATSVPDSTDATTEGGGVIVAPPAVELTTVKLNSTTENIRFFGFREVYSDKMLPCNNPGSGFEIKISGEGGVVNVRTQTSDPVSFRLYVDGVAYNNANGSPYYTINGVKNIEIPAISAGEHTLRLIRVSDRADGEAKFYNIAFVGAQVALEPLSEDALKVEFLGDGITGGEGLGVNVDDVTLSYSYLTALGLKSDYSIVAFEGQGLISGNSAIGSSYGTADDYTTNSADVVVLNVGGVDFSATGGGMIDSASFKIAYKTLLQKLREVNGAECKVVCVVTSSNAALTSAVSEVCQGLGGDQCGFYLKTLTAPTGEIPSVAEHSAYAAELISYISSIKDKVIGPRELAKAEQGYGTEVDFDSAEWTT